MYAKWYIAEFMGHYIALPKEIILAINFHHY